MALLSTDELTMLNCRQRVNNDSNWICLIDLARRIFFCTLGIH
ncbi:hypothetical protein HMPREF9069_01292 [Atopobium sp. oral taxon 810 str. F0209]|nr:hypothetical protein HMPREF9069_01292 [Atopobium sp. oral taxon 810 str. F0209]